MNKKEKEIDELIKELKREISEIKRLIGCLQSSDRVTTHNDYGDPIYIHMEPQSVWFSPRPLSQHIIEDPEYQSNIID